ncbi:protein mono-ADP-ribosyltransferase PARP12-like isoform X2 [Pseudorasbora parva]|uniref:protein mono-ADP-ribosyltransferase PARP12-like isoform X2 n=1 Tax=Pseudorasbora parva TaxID=51549 RepID=UPI00351F0410
MAEDTILKVLCGNHGAMAYERLLDISYGLSEISPQNSLDKLLRDRDVFTVIQRGERTEVFAQTFVKLCRTRGCDEQCEDLHLCKYELMMGRCNRHGCSFAHQQLMSEHNMRILRAHHMTRLSREELRLILLQSDSGLLPPVCVMFNRGRGPRGICPDGEKCSRLHICEDFIRGSCDRTDCERPHDFHQPRLQRILKHRGVSRQLMDSLPFIYRNILALKSHTDRRNTKLVPVRRIPPETNTENEICLSFVRGFCGDDKCSKTHFKMPYKWEVKVGRTWHDLPNSEQIERDYCDPSNIHSSGNEPVCFEEMILGLDEVRRLSTISSVLLPGFVFTTSWTWYWKDEYNRWIQYSSIAEMHRLSSVDSEQLEQKYQEYLQQNQEDSGIKFTAGKRFYELQFTDMKQRNEMSGTERPVRRRPVFVSSVDAQIARARCCGASKTHFYKGFPGFWDRTAIPDSGFQRVRLHPSHRDYVRVQARFTETLRALNVRQIERVQNRELWEDYMMKKERMKMANKYEQVRELLLFHGTRSSLMDGVCYRNFDFQEFEADAYGKGIYFSKDARFWDKRMDRSAVRRMFACRVLVGSYSRGSARFRRPPAKDSEGSLYDSCVDDPRAPSIFVVFDRSQIYPEFLITYEEVQSGIGACDENVNETNQTSVFTVPARVRNTHTHTAGSHKGPVSATEHTDSLITVLSSTLDTSVGASAALPVSAECTSSALPVSAECTSSALPVSAECASTALPVSAECASTALPVSAEHAPTALPVSAEHAPTALPISAECASTALPVSAECASTGLPVSAECASTALPVSAECASTALPVSAEHAPTALPVSAGHASTGLPVSAECASTALPVSAGHASTALPVSAEDAPTALPVSAECTSTGLPVSAECASTALPVSTGHASTALPVLPVLAKCASTGLPVSAECASTALPVSAGHASTALPVLPVSAECASTELPVSAECASTALPVSAECASNALPVSAEHTSTALPVSAEHAPTALPVSAECTSTGLPVSAECASNALPVSAEHASTALPVSAGHASTALPVSAERVSAQKKKCVIM